MEQASNPNKALWEKGDFCLIAESMRESGEAVAKELGAPGLHVLDVGCGDGTTAIPFAEAGCHVVGVDIASNLVRAGTQRANRLGLEGRCRFEEGDASNMVNIASDSFDLVYTQFGAMFAPKAADVAKELVRVTKPGGRIVMANWIAGDPTFVSQILRISAKYLPPPPQDFVSPVLWGKEEVVQERFAAGAGIPKECITCERKTYWFVHKKSALVSSFSLFCVLRSQMESLFQELVRIFRDYYGPTMNAFEAATKNGKQNELLEELDQLFLSLNTATNGTTRIPAVYLRVTVEKK